MRISEWSSDVCSSDLAEALFALEVERLRQQPLREALRQYLAVGGGRAQGIRHGAERKLDHATIEPRRTDFERGEHARPVHLGQNIVGQIGDRKSTRLNSSH